MEHLFYSNIFIHEHLLFLPPEQVYLVELFQLQNFQEGRGL
jgi:hypothetical protein